MHISRGWSSKDVSSLSSGVQVMLTLYYRGQQDYAYIVMDACYATGRIRSLRHVKRILGLEWTESKAPFSSDRRPDVCVCTEIKILFYYIRRLNDQTVKTSCSSNKGTNAMDYIKMCANPHTFRVHGRSTRTNWNRISVKQITPEMKLIIGPTHLHSHFVLT